MRYILQVLRVWLPVIDTGLQDMIDRQCSVFGNDTFTGTGADIDAHKPGQFISPH